MLRIIPIIIVAVLAVACLATEAGAATAPACQEDAPCWRWPTMGDHKRGVFIAQRHGTRHAVVGPCRFARLAKSGRLDSTTPRLRGDGWAINHGCD